MGAGRLDDALDRQRGRRAQGVPTIGVVEGIASLDLVRAVRGWADERTIGCVDLTDLAPSADELPGAWLHAVARSCDLPAVAARWLSSKLRRGSKGLPPSAFAGKTRYGWEALRQGLEGEVSATIDVCFRLLGAPWAGCAVWSWDALAAFQDLLGPADELLLLLSAWAYDADERLPAALARVVRLAEIRPRCAAVLFCPAGWLERHVPVGSRAAALLAEGRLLAQGAAASDNRASTPPAIGACAVPAALDRAPSSGGLTPPSNGAPPRTLSALPSTAAQVNPAALVNVARLDGTCAQPLDPSPALSWRGETRVAPLGDARSAAERYLFDRLNEIAATRGLFKLNVRVDTRGEPKTLEIDLVCSELKIAIELDGYYHFTDREAYRRDRRKDLALQRDGYVVLRFLSEDVVSRLEPILETVVRAVGWRRAPKEFAPWARTPSRRSPRSR